MLLKENFILPASRRSLHRNRLQSMQETLTFILYRRQRGIQALDAPPFDRSV
jgi:hypothetical protein